MRKRAIGWLLLASLVVAGCAVAVGPIMSQVETPAYDVVASHDSIDLREYAPMIIAQTRAEGEREEAIGDGFRVLADYIFGNNTTKADIAMTAPVQQSAAGEEIAMTAPVQQQSQGEAWQVQFVMPSDYTLETLPKPNDERVTLRQVPARRFVAITFSGLNSDENIARHEAQLQDFMARHDLQAQGAPVYAFYNPPWTLPFLRRNEVMIEVAADARLSDTPEKP